MINKYKAFRYCCEDISNIENYDKAIADTTQMWELHHRMETHRRNGTRRKFTLSAKLLRAAGAYLKRPASELIFLTREEHQHIGPCPEDVLESKSKASLGRGKGTHWYTNGIDNVRAYECPDGFVPGRIL